MTLELCASITNITNIVIGNDEVTNEVFMWSFSPAKGTIKKLI